LTQNNVDWLEDTNARITPEHIARARALVGYDEAATLRQQITTATEDSIRTFALAYGSDNPLHCVADYARRTRWGGVIAPGPMLITMGTPLRSDPRPEAVRAAKRGLFRGIHQIHSGTEWEWYRPVRPGDVVYRFQGEESVEVKDSEFAGTSVIRVTRTVFFNQGAKPIAIMRALSIFSERATAAQRGKYKTRARARYTDEDLARIDAIYSHETVRGARPRFGNDVETGDSLGTMAKGPLTVTDIVCFHTTGFAQLPFGPVTSRLAYQRRQEMPAAFVKDAYGVPDIVMRMHWDDEWAQAVGSPMAYDYGFMRECWLYHYLSDWCGDDGVIRQMRSEMRKFNYLGDTQTITGRVVNTSQDSSLVEVEVQFVNQMGETTLSGTAVIALPTQASLEPQFAPAPSDIAGKSEMFLSRHRELSSA
jgi:acyl dehydratase